MDDGCRINIETILEDDINEIKEDDNEQLRYILNRLELMVQKLKAQIGT